MNIKQFIGIAQWWTTRVMLITTITVITMLPDVALTDPANLESPTAVVASNTSATTYSPGSETAPPSANTAQTYEWFSVSNIINLMLTVVLLYIALVITSLKKGYGSVGNELTSLKKWSNKIDKRLSDLEAKQLEPQGRTVASNWRTNTPARQHTKDSSFPKNDRMNSETELMRFETSTTLLNATYMLDKPNEKQPGEDMLYAYRAIVENISMESIRKFCQQYKVSSAQRYEVETKEGTYLELLEDQSCSDSDLWVAPCDQPGHYYIMPGVTIRSNFKVLNAENSRLLKEIFHGIVIIVSSNKFELIDLGIAEASGDVITVTKMGRLGLPVEITKR